MKNHSRILTNLVVLALLCMVGIAAAQADTVTDTATTSIMETLAATSSDTQGVTLIDDIEPYDGPIGADSPLYGLKIALEDLDESFTTNQSERMNKQLIHARLRIAEVRRELGLNRTGSAQRALELYWQKINLTETTLTLPGLNTTGLLHAQEQVTRHQLVLMNLVLSHPNNTGLMRAYNNSLALEQKFEQKTQMRFDRITEKNNRTIVKGVRLEINEQAHAGRGDGTQNETEVRTRAGEKIQTRDTTAPGTTTTQPTPAHTQVTAQTTQDKTTPEVTATQQQGQSSSGNRGNGNDNASDNGKGNSRNK